MQTDSDIIELRALASRLEADPFFMASALAEYRSEMRLSDQQLAKSLDCSLEALTNLALCRTPRSGDERLFRSDVRGIAKYVGCDWKELARVVRTVHSLATLKQFSGMPEAQLLKAARDKRGEKDSSGKPTPRKRSRPRKR